MLFALGASYFVLLFKSSLRRDFCVGVRGKEETFVFYAACQCIDFDLFFWIYFKRGALGNLMILWHMNKKRHWRSCWVGSKKVHRGVQVEDHNVKNILFSWPEENPKYLDAKSTYLVLEITGYYLRKILTRRIFVLVQIWQSASSWTSRACKMRFLFLLQGVVTIKFILLFYKSITLYFNHTLYMFSDLFCHRW